MSNSSSLFSFGSAAACTVLYCKSSLCRFAAARQILLSRNLEMAEDINPPPLLIVRGGCSRGFPFPFISRKEKEKEVGEMRVRPE